MRNPPVPTLDDLLERAQSPFTWVSAIYAAGWIVERTLAPKWAQTYVAAALVVAPVAGAVLLARAAGYSLRRERCRARTNSGERCSRDAETVTAELCWQHGDMDDVELVEPGDQPQ
jgi:hypothetical protein